LQQAVDGGEEASTVVAVGRAVVGGEGCSDDWADAEGHALGGALVVQRNERAPRVGHSAPQRLRRFAQLVQGPVVMSHRTSSIDAPHDPPPQTLGAGPKDPVRPPTRGVDVAGGQGRSAGDVLSRGDPARWTISRPAG